MIIVPDVVIERLRRYVKDPEEVISRPAPFLGGKSPLQYVADGDGSWEEYLWALEKMFSYASTS